MKLWLGLLIWGIFFASVWWSEFKITPIFIMMWGMVLAYFTNHNRIALGLLCINIMILSIRYLM